MTPVRTPRAVRRFEHLLEVGADALVLRFGEAEWAVMRREMRDEYASLLPSVPSLGGRDNPWISSMTAGPWLLAVYRVVLRHGGSAEDAGKVAYDYARNLARKVRMIPAPLRPRIMGPRRSRAEADARWFQRRLYPDNWVCEVVDPAGRPFDVGMDVTQCAIVNYLHANDADDVTPYLCHLDYVLAEASGIGLVRTKTLAWGCDRCDFRYTVPGTTTATWPPEFPERRCGAS